MKTQVDTGGGRSPSLLKVIPNITNDPVPYLMILLCAILPLLHGCQPIDSVLNPDDERELGDIQSELDRNRAKWTSAMVSDYEFYFQWNCVFCDFGEGGPVIISVRESKIVDINFVVDDADTIGGFDFYTINGLFDFLQERIDRKVDTISAEYHSDLGYPTEVWIDDDIDADDDEMGFEIQWLSIE